MVETPAAIESIDEIASVDGIDVIMIGTNDLAMASGCPQDFGNPKIQKFYEKTALACKKYNKWLGSGGVKDEKAAKNYIEMELISFLRDRILVSCCPLQKIELTDSKVKIMDIVKNILKPQMPSILVAAGHGGTHWVNAAIYILLPYIILDLGLSYTQAGLIMTVFHFSTFLQTQ